MRGVDLGGAPRLDADDVLPQAVAAALLPADCPVVPAGVGVQGLRPWTVTPAVKAADPRGRVSTRPASWAGFARCARDVGFDSASG